MRNAWGVIALSLLGACRADAPSVDGPRLRNAASTTSYIIHDLGTLGSPGPFGGPPYSSAHAINGNGQIVGESDTDDAHHPFLWESGSLRDLGTLGGGWGVAWDINDLGQVVGTSTVAAGRQHAFFWDGGVMRDLGTLSGGYSMATRINGVGQVLGESDGQPVVWDQGAITALGLVAAVAINDRGQVAGTVSAGSAVHAAIWQAGGILDLGTLGGDSSWAAAISNSGLVVGRSRTALGAVHAFLWANGGMTDLGTLPGDDQSAAAVVDENGRVAGTSSNSQGRRGFVWVKGVMQDLGGLGGSSTIVSGLNRSGTIAGVSLTPTFTRRAFAWRDGTMTDLGSMHLNAGASALNQAGQVVGQVEVAQDVYHAAVWESVHPATASRVASR